MRTLLRVLDFETSGMPTDDDPHAICEIGWIDVVMSDGDWLVEPSPHSLLVDLGRPISVAARAVHHISDADVAGQASREEAVAILMGGMAPETSAFVAHFAEFENKFFDGAGVDFICSYKSALRIWPEAESHSNQFLRYFLGLELDHGKAMPPHRAGPDAYVTAHILHAILETGADIEEMIRWTAGPALLHRVTFGKHKGKLWKELPSDYLSWIADKSDLGRDEKANARHWLKQRGNT